MKCATIFGEQTEQLKIQQVIASHHKKKAACRKRKQNTEFSSELFTLNFLLIAPHKSFLDNIFWKETQP